MRNSWSFVAMQYYALILNRTFVVSVDAMGISGTVCRGLTGVEGGDSLTRYITAQLAVHGDLNDPNSYIGHTSIRPSRANFALSHADITSVIFNPKKKWGMGPYPHDGRVIVETSTRRREFIILGKQSGREIAERLFADVRSFKPEPLSGST